MKINGERLISNLNVLKTFTDTPGEGVTRFSFGSQDAKAREFIISKAIKAGCPIHIDTLQNIRIGLPGADFSKKVVLSGSHIDTVRNGGWLDGIFGVCAALEVLETLTENKETCDSFSNSFELIIFAEEEGSVFGSTMTGSKFITGMYGSETLDTLKDDSGRTLREVLNRLHDDHLSDKCRIYNTDEISLEEFPWDFSHIKAMFEAHIEQGPVLARENLSLGIVDSIFGMRVVEVTVEGVGNHAGATPMHERFDALSAAAECILAVEKTAASDPEHKVVATIGKMELQPNCSNVIPEKVIFSLEVRDKDANKINSYMDKMIEEINYISEQRGVSCTIREHSKSAPLHLCDRLIEDMTNSAEAKQLKYRVMDSGAVHDACMIAGFADTGMIFVPSIEGRSHVPEEDTPLSDLIAGAQFLMDAVISEMK